MAQVIETYCDWCLERGEQVRGMTYRVAVGLASGTRLPSAHDIDLCEDDAKPLSALLEAIEDRGRPVKGGQARKAPKAIGPGASSPGEESPPQGTPGDVLCPVEGCDYSTVDEGRLRGHVRRQHDMTVPEARGQDLPFQCDQCERAFAKPQGVIRHRLTAHPDASPVEASELRVAS